MRANLFDYDLPRALIAQRPLPERAASRLLQVDRTTGERTHHVFRDLPNLLRADDLLVVNNSKVIPVLLQGRRATGGRVEVLLLGRRADGTWKAMLKSNGKVRHDDQIAVGPADGFFRVLPRRDDKIRYLRWTGDTEPDLDRWGTTPLPPYIKRSSEERAGRGADRRRYQTVFATQEGSVAAPTAGLHFTRQLLRELGLEVAQVTLHVGLGTFAPIECEQIEDHRMHTEQYLITPDDSGAITTAKRAGRRIVAVGTTSARVLETAWSKEALPPGSGETDIFIHPPYEFKVVDAMITNFHLPRTSLLVMIAAFAGRERVLEAYADAIAKCYRFFSFGDAMLIT